MPRRVLGLLTATALLSCAALAGWWSRPELDLPPLTADELAAIPTTPSDECQDWLASYRLRIGERPRTQVLLVEATDAGAVTIGTGSADFARADDDATETNGWLVPSEALRSALADRPPNAVRVDETRYGSPKKSSKKSPKKKMVAAKAVRVDETRYGLTFRHTAIPIQDGSPYYLVVSQSYDPPSWFGPRGALVLAAAVAAIWAMGGRDE